MKNNIYNFYNKNDSHLEYINNIKYKNFHPIEKKNTIKKINNYIKNFNAVNDELGNISQTEMTELTRDKRVRSILAKNGISTRLSEFSLKYFHNFKLNITNFLNSLLKKRCKKIKKILDSTVINPTKKLSIKQICEEIENLDENLKDFKKKEQEAQLYLIKKKATEEISSLVHQIKTFMETDQEKKLEKSVIYAEKLVEATKNTSSKDQSKSYKYFKELLEVMNGKKDKLDSDCINFLDSEMTNKGKAGCHIRSWVTSKKFKPEDLQLCVLKNINDPATKNVILNFFSAVTDSEGINFLNKYIKEKTKDK